MALHEFELIITMDHSIVTMPNPCTTLIRVGDTLKFTSRHGKVHIEWSKNRFDKAVYEDGELASAIAPGPFLGQCYVELPSGVRMGWDGDGVPGQIEVGEQGAGAGNTR